MKFKGIAVSVLALAPVLLGRPSSGETLDHGEEATTPQPACVGVPNDAVFIPSVTQVWAIRQEGDQVRLVFSNQPISCALALSGAQLSPSGSELADLAEDTCTDSWMNEFSVVDARPGIFDLAQVGVSPSNAMLRVRVEQGYGCNPIAECRVNMVGSAGPDGDTPGPDATLELYAVTDECISGRLSNYKSFRWSPPPDMNGVFVAQWCSAE